MYYKIMLTTNRSSFISCFPVWMTFLLFFLSDCTDQTLQHNTEQNGKSKQPVLFLILEESSETFAIKYDASGSVFTYALYQIEEVVFYSQFVK